MTPNPISPIGLPDILNAASSLLSGLAPILITAFFVVGMALYVFRRLIEAIEPSERDEYNAHQRKQKAQAVIDAYQAQAQADEKPKRQEQAETPQVFVYDPDQFAELADRGQKRKRRPRLGDEGEMFFPSDDEELRN